MHAANVTLAVQQAAGVDWNGAGWSSGLGATATVAADPSATFELLPGSRLRSPNNGTDDTFPGSLLTADGSGVFVNNPGATALVSEIRFKQNTAGGKVTFPHLVMNGGQLDAGNDGTVTVSGQIDIVKNTPIYNDGTNDRGYIIDATLTGDASVEVRLYQDTVFRPTYVRNLNIAGNANTFKGKWNAVVGALVATGNNALGTNDITVGSAAALQATYNINSPKANLQLNGRFYLTHAHSFRAVTVGTTPLTKGVHTWAELNAAFPTNFPDTWTALQGAEGDVDVSGGSITVLEDNTTPVTITQGLTANTTVGVNTPKTFTVGVSGPVLSMQWYSNNVAIAGATGLTYTTPILTTAAEGTVYKLVLSNASGNYTTSTTVHIDTAPRLITLAIQQAAGADWNTAGAWSDGLAASVSVAGNPLNAYEVLPGARLRSINNGTDDTFPGATLTVDGSGKWVNNPAAGDLTTSEIRFKQSGDGKVTFPHLIMNGGQLDTGNAGTVHVAGLVEIAKDSAIYNDDVSDRGYVIEATLTGSGNIEYHGYNLATYNDTFTHNLNIAGSANTFSGKWNVVVGTLLGTGANGLGTNDITVGAQGALETTYDINDTTGSLFLNGRIFLHQTDTFRTVTINGMPLAKGTYTYADLAAQFPNNFPATWTPQIGADTFVDASGSIKVLEDNSIPIVQVTGLNDTRVLEGQTATFSVQVTGPVTSVKWFKNDVEISGATSLTYTTDPLTAADNNATYKFVVGNNVNSITASAKVTIGQLVLTQGFLKEEMFFGAQYDKDNVQTTTDTPTVTKYISKFETAQNQGDTYAERISGFITPTVSGDYVFFINADDDTYLHLSTDANPANKVLIATEPQYNDPLQWLATTRRTAGAAENRSDVYTGATIHLEANTSYYIEADHHEGTGGDHVEATFILAGTADPVNGTPSALKGLILSTMAIDGTTLSITAQPTNTTATIGATATFGVTVDSSSTNLFYQWQKNGANIAGANGATFTTAPLAVGDNATYRVIVSAPGAALQTSAGATLTVQTAAPNAATIKNVTFSGGAIHFAFGTQTGVGYTVEYKTALSDATWTTLKTVTGTGIDENVDDTLATGPRFYRVTAR